MALAYLARKGVLPGTENPAIFELVKERLWTREIDWQEERDTSHRRWIGPVTLLGERVAPQAEKKLTRYTP